MPSDTTSGYAMLLRAAVEVGLTASPPSSPATRSQPVSSQSISGQSILGKAESDEVALVGKDDPLMARAMRTARETLPGFFELASHPAPDAHDFGVKIAVREGCEVEYFWIGPFTRDGDRFFGRLDNRPRRVSSVRFGQTIAFAESEIVDWMYMDGNRMMGNYTARALLKNASPAERADFTRRFGLDLDF